MGNYEDKVESMLKRYRPIGPPVKLKTQIFDSKGNRWNRTWLAVAASIMFVAGLSILLLESNRPVSPEPTLAEIQRRVFQSGSAARLLASIDVLAKQTGGEEIARQQYLHIAKTYQDSPIAEEAMQRMNLYSERRLQK